MATGQTQFTDLSNDAVTLIKDETLDIAEKVIVFGQSAMKADLPQHNSKTVQFTRYKRVPLPQSKTTEGTTPTSTKLEDEIVTAVVDQWSVIVELTDIARLTIKHPLVPIAEDRLGTAMGELVDRELKIVLDGSSTVFAGSGNNARGDLLATDVVNAVEVRKLWRTLKRNGAKTFGTSYHMIVDPEVSQDVADEQKFRDAHQFVNVRALFNNEVGEWLGFRFMVSNMLPIIDLIADANWTFTSAATGGSLSTNTYFTKITAVDDTFGFEEDVSNEKSEATTEGGSGKITVDMPATTGFTYKLYIGTTTGDANLFLHSQGNAPSATVTLTQDAEVPTSGDNPPVAPATGVAVHQNYAFGRESYAMVRLSGDNLRLYITPDVPSDSDPILQRKKVSFKGSFVGVILNSDWVRRLESGSAF